MDTFSFINPSCNYHSEQWAIVCAKRQVAELSKGRQETENCLPVPNILESQKESTCQGRQTASRAVEIYILQSFYMKVHINQRMDRIFFYRDCGVAADQWATQCAKVPRKLKQGVRPRTLPPHTSSLSLPPTFLTLSCTYLILTYFYSHIMWSAGNSLVAEDIPICILIMAGFICSSKTRQFILKYKEQVQRQRLPL